MHKIRKVKVQKFGRLNNDLFTERECFKKTIYKKRKKRVKMIAFLGKVYRFLYIYHIDIFYLNNNYIIYINYIKSLTLPIRVNKNPTKQYIYISI